MDFFFPRQTTSQAGRGQQGPGEWRSWQHHLSRDLKGSEGGSHRLFQPEHSLHKVPEWLSRVSEVHCGARQWTRWKSHSQRSLTSRAALSTTGEIGLPGRRGSSCSIPSRSNGNLMWNTVLMGSFWPLLRTDHREPRLWANMLGGRPLPGKRWKGSQGGGGKRLVARGSNKREGLMRFADGLDTGQRQATARPLAQGFPP